MDRIDVNSLRRLWQKQYCSIVTAGAPDDISQRVALSLLNRSTARDLSPSSPKNRTHFRLIRVDITM